MGFEIEISNEKVGSPFFLVPMIGLVAELASSYHLYIEVLEGAQIPDAHCSDEFQTELLIDRASIIASIEDIEFAELYLFSDAQQLLAKPISILSIETCQCCLKVVDGYVCVIFLKNEYAANKIQELTGALSSRLKSGVSIDAFSKVF